MVVVIIVGAVMAIMGILILLGKGDNLIAGYNTASEEEKAKYNIKRLRLLLGVFLIAMAPLLFVLTGDSITHTSYFLAAVMILVFILLVLANTWAKKK